MNERIKKLWIDTLRSETVKQAQKKLCIYDSESKEYSFCCLGVLCEIYQSEARNPENKLTELKISNQEMGGGYSKYIYNQSDSYLPPEVMLWAELKEALPVTKNGTSLSGANDTGTSFEKIADYIEKGL